MKFQKMVLAMLVLVLAVTGFVTLPLNKTTLLNEGAKKVAQFSWGGSRQEGVGGQEIAGWQWGGSRTGGDSVEIAGLPVAFKTPQQIAGLPVLFVTKAPPQQIAGLPALLISKTPPGNS